MKIGMLVDSWGTVDQTPEDEYLTMENIISNALTKDINCEFKHDVLPDDLVDSRYDIYVFDYGAVGLMGAGGYLRSFMRTLIKVAEEQPNILIILWSNFTALEYINLINVELNIEQLEGYYPNIWIMVSVDQRLTLAAKFKDWFC